MELTSFTVATRESKGKGPAGRSRHAGNVPGVIYGAGKENVSIVVDKKSFDHLIHGGQGEHSLVELTVSNNAEFSGPAMLKDVQHHPVSGAALHFDLVRIDMNKKIITQVPIKLEGHSIGIIEGGVLDYHMREVDVECLPLDVPTELVGDITEMNIGDSFLISDFPANDKITILTDVNRAVAAVQQPRVVQEDEPGEVAEVGLVGEDGEDATEDAAE
jgi:large subunit ribosomal protein L25